MKYFFFFAGLLAVNLASAQNNNNKSKKSLDNLQQRNIVVIPGTQQKVLLLSEKNLSFTLPNGNKVYSLPQDNMPCVVPNVTLSNMPNPATPDMIPKTKNSIPDPSKPTAAPGKTL